MGCEFPMNCRYISSNTCMNFITPHRNNQWLRNLFTEDEKWVLYVNHRRRCQCPSRGQTGVATPKVDSHSKTLMLSVLWESEEQLIEIFFQSGVQSPPLSAVSSWIVWHNNSKKNRIEFTFSTTMREPTWQSCLAKNYRSWFEEPCPFHCILYTWL